MIFFSVMFFLCGSEMIFLLLGEICVLNDFYSYKGRFVKRCLYLGDFVFIDFIQNYIYFLKCWGTRKMEENKYMLIFCEYCMLLVSVNYYL